MFSFGARSVQVVFSFGFWDVGVKNVATADSAHNPLISEIAEPRSTKGGWGAYSSCRFEPSASAGAERSGHRRRVLWTSPRIGGPELVVALSRLAKE